MTMSPYSLAKLAQRPKGTKVELAAISDNLGARQAFLKAERVVLRGMAKFVREALLPEAEREMRRNKLTQDMGRENIDALALVTVQLTNTAIDTVKRILALEGRRHTAKFKAIAQRTLGVDLSAVVRDEDLDDYLQTASTRAALLITGMTDDVKRRIANTVSTAVINAIPVKDLRSTLVADFRVADSRARLIARDQVAKVTSDLNRKRHQQAGLDTYRWLTSHDERVRPRHKALEGKIYKYGDPTGAEGGLPPGQPIQCRCVARAIVEIG